MKARIGRSLLGVAVSALISTAAVAADLPPAPPVVAPPAPPPMAAPAFDWSGPYVGAVGLAYFEGGFASFGAGGAVGYDFVRNRLLVGAEVQVVYFFDGPNYDVVGRTRVGVLAGERLLLYGVGGYGWYGGASTGTFFQVGAGAELGLNERMSLRAEAAAYFYPGLIGWHVALGAFLRPGK